MVATGAGDGSHSLSEWIQKVVKWVKWPFVTQEGRETVLFPFLTGVMTCLGSYFVYQLYYHKYLLGEPENGQFLRAIEARFKH